MEPSTFHHMLFNLEKVTLSEITDLQDLSEQHPYCSLYKILMAKIAKENDGLDYREMLASAALRSPNRKHLKSVLETQNLKQFFSLTLSDETTSGKYLIPQHKLLEEDNFVSSESGIKNNNTLNLPSASEVAEPKMEGFTAARSPEIEAEANLAEQIHASLEEYLRVKTEYEDQQDDEQAFPDAEEKSITEEENKQVDNTYMTDREHLLKEQSDLIDRFIADCPSVSRPLEAERESTKAVDLSNQSTKMSSELYTENLAKIMERQGNFSEAVKIYEALIWKFPEKKAYFVNCIEKLQNQK